MAVSDARRREKHKNWPLVVTLLSAGHEKAVVCLRRTNTRTRPDWIAHRDDGQWLWADFLADEGIVSEKKAAMLQEQLS